MQERPEEREVLSPRELAAYLGCSDSYVAELLANGSIKSFKVGRLRKIRLADARRFIDERAREEEAVAG